MLAEGGKKQGKSSLLIAIMSAAVSLPLYASRRGGRGTGMGSDPSAAKTLGAPSSATIAVPRVGLGKGMGSDPSATRCGAGTAFWLARSAMQEPPNNKLTMHTANRDFRTFIVPPSRSVKAL
jgi:hypothetical protein